MYSITTGLMARGRSGLGSALCLVAAALFTKSLWMPTFVQVGRREMLAIAVAAPLPAVAAVEPCAVGANNCHSTASAMKPWKWPTGTSRDVAIKELRTVIEAYPKEGQDGVDQGGWSFAVDDLSSKGYARVEFLSGIGNFAKFFNGGKPFVDDFEVSVEDDKVSVRSSSRVGDSDFGVNAKRINYIASGLRAKGWEASGV